MGLKIKKFLKLLDMNIRLRELKNIQSENCVTIILNTHRTIPDNEKDVINLKNLVKEAENRLLGYDTKRNVTPIIENLKKLADNINHQENIESLVLFVNEEIAEFTRLPIQVTNRVVIDQTFATRDLVRALHSYSNYYVLVLNRDKVRLIEAFNDKVVQELDGAFPFESPIQFTSVNSEPSNASRLRNLTSEFFNEVDKAVQLVRKENPLPVLITAEQNTFHEFLSLSNQKDSIFETCLTRSRQNEKANAIVSDAWDFVKGFLENRNKERINELEKAVGQNKFLSDTNEIHRGILEGRVQTLFVEHGLYQPAVLEADSIVYVSENERNDKNVIDDIYDELIELNMDFGGDVVFLPPGKLEKFNGFGAVTRY